MAPTWFDLNFCWIGLALCAVVLVLLFGTNVLRRDTSISRWKDLYWLGWLGVAAYLLHNVEEYGIALTGQHYLFATMMEDMMLSIGGHEIPYAFFTAVNVPMFWVALPLLAWIGKKRPLASLAIAGLLLVNGCTHVIPAIVGVFGTVYNPGLLTALVVFLPLSVWMISRCGKAPKRVPARVAVVGVLLAMLAQAVLMASMFAYEFGAYDSVVVLCVIQVLNAALGVFLPWWIGGFASMRPRPEDA